MVALALAHDQLSHLFKELGHELFSDFGGVLHRRGLVNLEQPQLALSVWEEVEAVDTDSALSPFNTVPGRKNALNNNLFRLWVPLRVPDNLTSLQELGLALISRHGGRLAFDKLGRLVAERILHAL